MLNVSKLRHARCSGPDSRSDFTLLEILIGIAVHATGE